MSDDPLREEHEALQRAVLASRKAFEATPEGTFAKAMRGAMDDYHAMREQGVSREDAVKGIEAVLRANWPNKPTQFPPCQRCGDTGWEELRCTHDHRCGRNGATIPDKRGGPGFKTANCAEAHPSHEHAYVLPCSCPHGDKHRPRAQRIDDAIQEVGRRTRKSKPTGFSRF